MTNFTLTQEQQDKWFPDLTSEEIKGCLEPKESPMDMDLFDLAVKVETGIPLTRDERVRYIRFKTKALADETRAAYKKLTGVTLK